jgi:protein phosphatase
MTWPFQTDAALSDEENRLITAIRLANRQIYEHSVRSRDLRGMGTTVVGALFSSQHQKMYIGHVGDSRAYRVRAGEITQLTRDHSLLNDYLAAMPDMSEEQRSELPKNVITRALGMQDSVEIDLVSDDARVDDVYVLCSDGLSGMVEDEDLLDVVSTNPAPEDACRRLVTMANEHGGEDNVTAVVIKIVGSPPSNRLEFAATQELPGVRVASDTTATGVTDPLAQTDPADGEPKSDGSRRTE